MAQVTRAASKLKFETGDVPTQADFGDLHDSVTWYDEGAKNSDSINIGAALGSAVLAETFPAYMIGQAMGLGNGTLRFYSIWLPSAQTLTGVKWYQTTKGVYTGSNYNGWGLYTYSAGTLALVASSTADTEIWKGTSQTTQSKAFSATYSAAAGLYFVASLYCSSAQTTAPSIGEGGGLWADTILTLDYTNSSKLLAYLLTQTALPSTQSMSGLTTATGTSVYAGLY